MSYPPAAADLHRNAGIFRPARRFAVFDPQQKSPPTHSVSEGVINAVPPQICPYLTARASSGENKKLRPLSITGKNRLRLRSSGACLQRTAAGCIRPHGGCPFPACRALLDPRLYRLLVPGHCLSIFLNIFGISIWNIHRIIITTLPLVKPHPE